MDKRIEVYLKEFYRVTPGVSIEAIRKFETQNGFKLPEDYAEFMCESNGGEGEVGRGGIFLFSLEELAEVNDDYAYLLESNPDYYLFAKDAADTGYAFHKLTGAYYSFGLLSSLEEPDSVEFCGNTLVHFLEHIYKECMESDGETDYDS